MTTTAPVVDRERLRVGRLLAEGGEGLVYELGDHPGLLYKGYRSPAPTGPLAALVAWPETVMARAPELARRVGAAAAWPAAVVTAEAPNGSGAGGLARGVGRAGDRGLAAGLLLPRAPRRFSLRHRDGSVHLATLSYLTAAPGQRSAAYGLALPAPMSPERLGIVYALARLLEALQSADPAIGHGDLSTKNVLWSLERGPEVFLIDCDSAERYRSDGELVDDVVRRRAMTPNWDDPAIPPGSNPTLESDRYSLALIFLRVAGAAHFPIQGRQRSGEALRIDFDVPAGAAARARSLDAGAPIWDLCERSLSVAAPAGRPLAAAWSAALEQVLDDLGAMATVRAVWTAQGGGAPGPTPPVPAARPERPMDVIVRPVVAGARTQHWSRLAPSPPPVPGRRGVPGPATAPFAPNPLAAGGYGRPTLAQAALAVATAPPVPVIAPARAGLRRAIRLWLDLHHRMFATLTTRGRIALGLVRLAGCAVIDLMMLAVVAFVLAMIISPVLRI